MREMDLDMRHRAAEELRKLGNNPNQIAKKLGCGRSQAVYWLNEEGVKPCPFCGGEVSIAETGDKITRWYFITRGNSKTNRNCNCRVFMESNEVEPYSEAFMKIAKEMLIEAWNRRAGE